MEISELYLKTMFCCIACDGEIAREEIVLIKNICNQKEYFRNVEVENVLNGWIKEINENGNLFLSQYIANISSANMEEKEQIELVDLAIKAIESDEKIDYNEIKFFKKIKSFLTVSDDMLLQLFPNNEEFFLPDIIDTYDLDFLSFDFQPIDFEKFTTH